MLAEERLRKILTLLEEKKAVSVTDLCQETGASEATIRRDLNELDRQGKLSKVHGGAVLPKDEFQSQEPDILTKSQLNVEQKQRIARYAAAQVNDDDFVFIDAGTTTLLMAEYLTNSKATFVTTGIECARRLVEKGLRVYVPGGLLKPGTQALVGAAAVDRALQLHQVLHRHQRHRGAPGLHHPRHGGGLHQVSGGGAVLSKLCAGRFQQVRQGGGGHHLPAPGCVHPDRPDAGRNLSEPDHYQRGGLI